MECFICQEEIFNDNSNIETPNACDVLGKCKENDTKMVDENIPEPDNVEKGKARGDQLSDDLRNPKAEWGLGFGKMKCCHVFHDMCIFYEFVEQIKNSSNVLYCPYCKVTQSKSFFENLVRYLEIKETPFYFKKVSKCLNLTFDKELCCVYNPTEMRQCKRKYKKEIKKPKCKKSLENGKSSEAFLKLCTLKKKQVELDADQFFKYNISHVYNSYDFLRTNMCTFHQNHETFVKGIIHPIYKILYTKCID